MDYNNFGIIGIIGIENNLENNNTDVLRGFVESSDFIGFKYLVEEKIGRENSVPFLCRLVERCYIGHIDILEYITGLGVELNMSKIAFDSFMCNKTELFRYIKSKYRLDDVHIFDIIKDYFEQNWMMTGHDPEDEDIVKVLNLIDICKIELKTVVSKSNKCVLDILLEHMPPSPELIQMIIKQKAGYLLSEKRQHIFKMLNYINYPSSGWLRSLS